MPSEETTRLLPQKQSDPPSSERRYKSIIVSVCSFILVTELCERLAYYGLSGSLPIFFHKHLGLSSVLATEMNSTFTSLSYLTPLIGAYVADRHLGRFTTIVRFCCVYLFGLTLCVIASLPQVMSLPLFMLGLFGFVALGAGGIKPNVVVLGADQFDISDPSQRAEKDSFFNWFYWSVNIGATFSYAVLTNIAVNGIPPYVEYNYGFFLSFLIPTIAFMCAFSLFLGGKSRYRQVPPKNSALSRFFGILLEAGTHSSHGKFVLSGWFAFIPGILFTTASYFILNHRIHMMIALCGAACVVYGAFVLIVMGSHTNWVRFASQPNGGSYTPEEVKDVIQVIRLSPFMSMLVIFWTVYGQQQTNFILQGCQMDLRLNNDPDHPYMISSAMLSVFDSSVILVFIPIFDRIIYPTIRAFGIAPTILRKIGAGLCFAFLSMMLAAWLEQWRKQNDMIDGIASNCSSEGEMLPMSTVSIWWQSPQFFAIGLSEILVSISSYDLFYSEVPESMRSVCQALNLLTTTLGYIVAGGLNSIFSFWITTDLNEGHLEYIYYVVAFLVFVNIVAFAWVSQHFVYHAPQPSVGEGVSGFSPALPRYARRLISKLSTPKGSRK